MTEGEPDELVVTPPGARAIRTRLPETVAAAVIEPITAALVPNPQRVGTPLRADLAGIHSAGRGTYRVLYRINEPPREVIVARSTTAAMPTACPDRRT
ncbi:MAG: type II toxin-antitoxin system RelE/ParE family toxin [Ornithinibacter sp.]